MAENDRRIAALIAAEIGARAEQAEAAIALIDEGSTVPFIARYRKEATGGLDDGQLRTLAERLVYLRELESRRAAILESIRAQDKLTPPLEAQIVKAATKAELEDLYLPYKPKRRTKADIARERGLGPLAEAILADRKTPPADLARRLRRRRDRRREGRARRRARHPLRKLRRQRRPRRPACAPICATRRCCAPGSRTASRRRARNSPTISTIPSVGRTCPAIARSRCCAAATRVFSRSSLEVDAERRRRPSRSSA